ncbi:YadA family autotransporter adhesin [Chelatococcus daeguensis]|uniref:YadA family autotransporter adhesin n=1 Tax=Chelatococcus daeguensis TaxID=444444 RepID=UPI0032AF3E43
MSLRPRGRRAAAGPIFPSPRAAREGGDFEALVPNALAPLHRQRATDAFEGGATKRKLRKGAGKPTVVLLSLLAGIATSGAARANCSAYTTITTFDNSGSGCWSTSSQPNLNAQVTAGNDSYAIGSGTVVTGSESYSLGNLAIVNGEHSYAIGTRTSVTGNSSYAIGDSATVTGGAADAYAIGTRANASADSALAMGKSASATAVGATAVGLNAVASSDNALAFGTGAQAAAVGAAALGRGSTALGVNSTAVGSQSQAVGAESTALGNNAQVTGAGQNAVALGAGSVADQANTVSVGSVGNERRMVNLAEGVDRTDAVNVGQLRDVENALNDRMNILQGTVLETR